MGHGWEPTSLCCCFLGTGEDETIALGARNSICTADPLRSSRITHGEGPRGQRIWNLFSLHSSTCPELKIVSFLRNTKLQSELLKKRWPCQALRGGQRGAGEF